MTDRVVSEVLSSIEAELRALWSSPDDATGMAKVRASTMNFVVASVGSDVEGYRVHTDDLAETHAGRVLLLSLDGRLPAWTLNYAVSGVCRPSASGAEPICNDRIELSCGVAVGERAASVIRALALPEVPIVCELGARVPTKLADSAVRAADRVIVDSRRTPLRRIVELSRQSHASFADRGFARLHPWRDLIARCFDDVPEAAHAIRRVAVHRTVGDGVQDASDLLMGWLGSRLGWSADDGRLSFGGQEIAFERVDVPATPDLPAGTLMRVEIEAVVEQGALCCDIGRIAATGAARWARRGIRQEEQDVAIGVHDEGWILAKLLDTPETDRFAKEALLFGARVAGV